MLNESCHTLAKRALYTRKFYTPRRDCWGRTSSRETKRSFVASARNKRSTLSAGRDWLTADLVVATKIETATEGCGGHSFTRRQLVVTVSDLITAT